MSATSPNYQCPKCKSTRLYVAGADGKNTSVTHEDQPQFIYKCHDCGTNAGKNLLEYERRRRQPPR